MIDNKVLNSVFNEITSNLTKYKQLKDFYLGIYTHKLRDGYETVLNEFRNLVDNMTGLVIDSIASRLLFDGFESVSVEVDSAIEQIMRYNKFDTFNNCFVKEALIYGKSYCFVEQIKNELSGIKIYNQNPASVLVNHLGYFKFYEITDDDNKVVAFLNHYTNEEVFKYKKNGSSFELVEVLENPYVEIPIFEFNLEQSEVEKIKPLQLLLNRQILSLVIATEYSSFKQKWATGIDIPINPETGKPVDTFLTAVNRVWASPNEQAKFGEFSESNLNQFIAVINDTRHEIARLTRTPLHLLMLDNTNLSGEAMKVSETAFASKIYNLQLLLGDVYEEMFSFILKQTNTTSDDVVLVSRFASPYTRNEMQELRIAEMKRRLGVAESQCLKEIGYTESQIDEFDEENIKKSQINNEKSLLLFDKGII